MLSLQLQVLKLFALFYIITHVSDNIVKKYERQH